MNWNLDHNYSTLPSDFWAQVQPTSVKNPELVLWNQNLANELGIGSFDQKNDLLFLAGNQLPPAAMPIAQAYFGHQFGHLNRLGDGRAILLGEHMTSSQQRFDIQLKGSGPTPFSRSGDGRAALGPMLREYLISEAMFFLGIPTTRSLAVVKTGETIDRDRELPGAILTRIASSHIRVGTFQFAAHLKTPDSLKTLADYTIGRHYKDIQNSKNPYLDFLKAVCTKQAHLIAKWLHVGFIHGVMNTDNMSICGETIDYGPCAFMDQYHPETVFSSIDRNGRYAYNQQASIGLWNLTRFAETLLPLLSDDFEQAKELAQEALQTYQFEFENSWLIELKAKFGFQAKQEVDITFLEKFMKLMLKHSSDYTQSFRNFFKDPLPQEPLFHDPEFLAWKAEWLKKIQLQNEDFNLTLDRMNQVNPFITPRNHQVEAALAAAEQNDLSLCIRLLEALKNPYLETVEFADLATPPNQAQAGYRTFCGT